MRDLPISESALISFKLQCRHFNVFPIFLPHYYPVARKKSHPISESLTALVKECRGYIDTMSQDEIFAFVDAMHPAQKMFLDTDRTNPIDDAMRDRIAVYYLVGKAQEGYLSFRDALFPDLNKSAVFAIYPALADQMDDEGLLPLDDRFEAHAHGAFL
jgi:hypothetical protein